MKRIPTSKPLGLPYYALTVCALIIATIGGTGSAMAADNGPKVTLVYDHALPNVPGKSMKGVFVEYGPSVATGARIHPKSAGANESIRFKTERCRK
jgi:hypothetical protein